MRIQFFRRSASGRMDFSARLALTGVHYLAAAGDGLGFIAQLLVKSA